MPRAIWSGSISFGLINIPVKLYAAISERSVRFNQIDRRNGARVKMVRTNAETGEEVPWAEIVKGYEITSGVYVTLGDDELAALGPDVTHTIDLECFVDLDEIDPIYFEGAYHVAPSGAAKPYALLVQAMEESNKVAIAKYVMRSKQYLAALRPKDGTLLLSTMVYADELNAVDELREFDALGQVSVDEREIAMARQLIDSLSESFDPEMFHDTYRTQVLDLIDRKAAGEQVTVGIGSGPSAETVIDLMAALEASVAAAKDARERHPSTATPADGASEDGSEPSSAEPAEPTRSTRRSA